MNSDTLFKFLLFALGLILITIGIIVFLMFYLSVPSSYPYVISFLGSGTAQIFVNGKYLTSVTARGKIPVDITIGENIHDPGKAYFPGSDIGQAMTKDLLQTISIYLPEESNLLIKSRNIPKNIPLTYSNSLFVGSSSELNRDQPLVSIGYYTFQFF